ncbi:MAG: glycoside hydrolase 5 family protein [Nakamurella sp.]
MTDPTRPPRSAFTSRRGFLAGAAGLGAAAALTALPGTASADAITANPGPQHPHPRPRPKSFVTTRNGHFIANGKTFRFGGTNTYYLHQRSHYMIDAALNDAAAMSLAVVRAWAFADGTHNDHPLQPTPYSYDEDAFDSLDYAVWKAGQLGLRLVLTLTNNWPDYGGMSQYVSWFLGLPDDVYDTAVNHDKFYTTKSIKDCYQAYAKHVIRRRNRYTGLRYNEDPTIMTFELANEPRNRSDKSGAAVLAWAAEMSGYVKSLAPRQLVSVGDEGFYGDASNDDYPYSNYEGNHWKKLVALPHVDYGTVHLYPGSWGETPSAKPGTDPVAWGTKWINDHLDDGARLRKPVVIEEYGLQVNAHQGIPDVAARDAGYTAWTGAVEARGAGDQFWLLTSRIDDGSFYPDYDGFRIVWDSDPGNTSKSTAALLSAHAKTMGAAR